MQFQSKWLNMKMFFLWPRSTASDARRSSPIKRLLLRRLWVKWSHRCGQRKQVTWSNMMLYLQHVDNLENYISPSCWDSSVGTHVMYRYIYEIYLYIYIYVRSWFGTCPFTLHHVSHMAASNMLFCDERSLVWCISTWEHIYLHNHRVYDEKSKM